MTTSLRIARRSILLTLHVLLGLLLTPLAQRRVAGGWRTSPTVTSWWHARTADILGVVFTVSGPKPQGPALLVANHVSWLDIVVLGALTPTVFLSKYEVRRWPVVGWLAARAGTLFIRRGDGQAGSVTAQIADRLRGGAMLTLFPEGTTTDGRDVRPFFPRLLAAAAEAQTPIVPVALRYHVAGAHDPVAPYTDNQSIAANLAGLMRRERTEVHVAVGEAIYPGERGRRELAKAARETIVTALAKHAAGPFVGRNWEREAA